MISNNFKYMCPKSYMFQKFQQDFLRKLEKCIFSRTDSKKWSDYLLISVSVRLLACLPLKLPPSENF